MTLAPAGRRITSAIGTKQTSPSALHMSAFDPKRTSASSLKVVNFEQIRMRAIN